MNLLRKLRRAKIDAIPGTSVEEFREAVEFSGPARS
jgi:hypothetical protein